MLIDHNLENVWEEHIWIYTYYTYWCSSGAAIVEPNGKKWFWQVDKPEDGTWWCDEVYELEEFDGWWGYTSSKEDAQAAALKALGI